VCARACVCWGRVREGGGEVAMVQLLWVEFPNGIKWIF
jgi:hypothetical protein